MVFTELFVQLEKLTPKALFHRTREVKDHERNQTAIVLAHLAEIDTRKLFLEFGHSNLFDYCMHGLGYSEAETSLRIHACRAARRFPALLESIARGTISLTVASKIAPVLNPENADELLRRAEGMTRRQAEELVVEFRPRPVVTSGVRAASVPSKARTLSGPFTPEQSEAGEPESPLLSSPQS